MPPAAGEADLAREGVCAAGHSSDWRYGLARSAQDDVSDDDVHAVRLRRSRHTDPMRVATGRAASTVVACHELVRTREAVGGYPGLRAAPLDGLEPPTQRLGRARSIQLSYRGTVGSPSL
jgi:hypothetical protein